MTSRSDPQGRPDLSPGDVHRLKMSLHRAIDELFDAFEPQREVVPIEQIHFLGDMPDWEHPFPKGPESITDSRAFEVLTAAGKAETPIRVAGCIGQTRRDAFGLAARKRWVVFGAIGSVGRYYPWLEWVETDTDMVAAEAPDAVEPRKGIRDPRQAPDFLEGVDLARSEQLFERIASGKTLRMVLPADDQREMVRIAAEIARLRRRPPWNKIPH